MNKKELEEMMKRHGDTQATLAEAMGITRMTLNNKLNERYNTCFTQPEILAIKKRYNLSAEEVEEIFFR